MDRPAVGATPRGAGRGAVLAGSGAGSSSSGERRRPGGERRGSWERLDGERLSVERRGSRPGGEWCGWDCFAGEPDAERCG
ncbi:hypothetical protein GUJ93_ZPchr0008g12610 [Zizania palustris]|uniref:Uncharacterized protein n=1 Tax=Zizania palustris TaxID=103762 RepID=A0A8J5R6U4_ZIZPA|nr:hypothetical protein GUJ93_ZPchr0008g12610 [Zizania palustris]